MPTLRARPTDPTMPLDREVAMPTRTDDSTFDVHYATPFSRVAEGDGLGPPHHVVPVSVSDDSVCEFVRHNLGGPLEAHRENMHGDFDGLAVVPTDTQSRLVRVESETPSDEIVALDLGFGELGHGALQGEVFHTHNIEGGRNKSSGCYNPWAQFHTTDTSKLKDRNVGRIKHSQYDGS